MSRHLRVYEPARQRKRDTARRMWLSSAAVIVTLAALVIIRLTLDLAITWRLVIGGLMLLLAAAQWHYLAVLTLENRDRYRGRH